MNKFTLTVALAVLIGCSGAALAGFKGPTSVEKATVAQAKEMKDDTHVILQGYIESSLGDEDYMFKDETGTIRVEIDHDVWRGLDVTPNDKVEIQGEVDTHFYKPTEIDVKRIQLVK